ncbi:MAG: hypothetical protein K2U26_11220 [Cyclobacteriaceae bacterium]|nr:hypothetical protein [Cyclobacteriaceae bacterium]
MKALVLFISLMATQTLVAQTPINKTYPLKSGQTVSLHFDYPDIVRITTWDKNEIAVSGTVSINSGESDDAFELIQTETGNELRIENKIRDMKSLPHRMTIVDRGQKIVFKSKADYKKYAEQNGKNHEFMTWGLEMDILLEVKIPKGVATIAESVYGIVEVKDFAGPLTVRAHYGGIDAALSEKNTGELEAETNYGQIYTNLDIKFQGDGYTEKNFYTHVSAKPGTGPRYSFESKYGNVYLRKNVGQ